MTFFNDKGTYYEVLEISYNASPHEVREAYFRAKSAYSKDSVAIYSLIDPGERDTLLRRIEEAYEVLSDADKRKQYDNYHGIIETSGTIHMANIVSIDRVPPMDAFGGSEDSLVAPATDFLEEVEVTPNPPPSSIVNDEIHLNRGLHSGIHYKAAPIARELEQEILSETTWNGSFIRRVREAQKTSIEEMSNITKISKTYLQAIELEDYKKLPAFVFVRGFLVQICRILRLPTEKVIDAYSQRFKAAKTD